MERRSPIHFSATESSPGSRLQVRTLPTFSVCTKPLSSNTCKCCTTAARVMSRGSANRETDMGPWLSLSTIARRVGSPRAWKTRSMLTFWLGMLANGRQLFCQLFQQFAPSVFAHFRAIGALEECSLMREDEVGPFFRWQEFKGCERRRNALIAERHSGSSY